MTNLTRDQLYDRAAKALYLDYRSRIPGPNAPCVDPPDWGRESVEVRRGFLRSARVAVDAVLPVEVGQ